MTQKISELNVMQQGAENFPWVSQWVDALVLSANTAASYNVTAACTAMGLPAGTALFLSIAADGPYWANFTGGTAAVPGSNITNGTGSEYQPNQRYIDESITAISFISTPGANVSLAFYRP